MKVCTAYAAVKTGKTIIAQINPNVPRTHGHAFIPFDCFDYVVNVNEPIPAIEPVNPTEVELKIGQHLASLIKDGSTLQMGIGSIPNAVLSCLKNHKNLGIHTGNSIT